MFRVGNLSDVRVESCSLLTVADLPCLLWHAVLELQQAAV
jgi:hypothetical protein